MSLGPAYRGSRISRSVLEKQSEEDSAEEDDEEEGEDSEEESENNAEYDDPDAVDLAADEAQAGDSEIESDNAFAESDAERFAGYSVRGSYWRGNPIQSPGKRINLAGSLSSSAQDEHDGQAGSGDDDEGGTHINYDYASEDNLDSSEDSGEDEVDEEEDEGTETHDKAPTEEESEDKKSSNASRGRSDAAAPSNHANVEKVMAVRKQRNIYDGLLNLRIRLQKALVAANTFPMVDDELGAESEPYEAAEEAAIKLLETMSNLRANLAGSYKTGVKRKRELAASMSSEAIWEGLQEEDVGFVGFRKSRLEKWSRKVQSVNVAAQNSLGQRNRTVVDVVEAQLADAEGRLVKRTRVPRSCAPAQASRKINHDDHVYDDADFYQLLLKELVDQRTVESAAAQAGGVATVMLTAAKEAKTRKQVDRKASKGRKMRFTVHEKLENFMAPEDRRSWEQAAIDRLFGTLFGRKMELDEEENEGEETEALDGEAEGLRLFRS